ncbi:MAG TPA: aminoglycoside phosphotransferase family protein [Rhizobiaceae bacterium]|nr:aminoglycoside phosphotransferase family protein [Rhizobiaceae bacterium]
MNCDDIDAALVSRLIASQFPEWASLPVRPVALSGWDNRTFRLGGEMSVRLPSAAHYVGQVEKEHRWLPVLAPQLPLPIPAPIAMGQPDKTYPWPWSVYRWIEGEPASAARIDDPNDFAATLAEFLRALYAIDAREGPAAGTHNFYRGGPVATYDGETRAALEKLAGEVDTALATEVWECALASRWEKRPVWVHGDVASGNLLVRNGKLAAVIDFGSSGVGDPACDCYVAWTFLDAESRAVFRSALGFDAETWARGRGWTLWKGLIVLAEHLRGDQEKAAWARQVIDTVLADHREVG